MRILEEDLELYESDGWRLVAWTHFGAGTRSLLMSRPVS